MPLNDEDQSRLQEYENKEHKMSSKNLSQGVLTNQKEKEDDFKNDKDPQLKKIR